MNLESLSQKLSLELTNNALYEQAFTHRSYLNEHPDVEKHNERLEFLGDAVVELIVTEFLYEQFPDKPEGELTSLRSALVRRNTLGQLGQTLGFDEYIRLSKGEAGSNGKSKAMILSNTVEAFIGALFLDQGLPAVKKFLDATLLPLIEGILKEEQHVDAKSKFQEVMQEKEGITPHYETQEVTGPDHDRRFVIGVYVGERLVATGEGSSKREAEMNAATKALSEL